MIGLFLLDEDYEREEPTQRNTLQNHKQDEAKRKEVLKDVDRNDANNQDIGGLSSYLKRNLPFIKEDEKIFKQIHTALKGVKTEGEKVALLKKIDSVIANTSGSGEITWKDIAVTAGIIATGGGILIPAVYNIGKWFWGKTSSKQEFLDRMQSVRAAVARYPVSKNTQAEAGSYTR